VPVRSTIKKRIPGTVFHDVPECPERRV
jgi:hypothetical protein